MWIFKYVNFQICECGVFFARIHWWHCILWHLEWTNPKILNSASAGISKLSPFKGRTPDLGAVWTLPGLFWTPEHHSTQTWLNLISWSVQAARNKNPQLPRSPAGEELALPLLSRRRSGCTLCWAALHSLKQLEHKVAIKVVIYMEEGWTLPPWADEGEQNEGSQLASLWKTFVEGRVWEVGREALTFWDWHWGTVALLFCKILISKCLGTSSWELWWSDLVLRSKSSSWLKGGIPGKWSFPVLSHEQERSKVETSIRWECCQKNKDLWCFSVAGLVTGHFCMSVLGLPAVFLKNVPVWLHAAHTNDSIFHTSSNPLSQAAPMVMNILWTMDNLSSCNFEFLLHPCSLNN